MKNLKIPFLYMCLLFACSKKNTSNPVTISVVGKWSLLPGLYEGFTNGSLTSTTSQQYDASDYVEFKTDGTMQSKTFGTIYNSQYKVENDSLIIDNAKKAKINTLTAKSLSYSIIDNLSATYYTRTTINLKK